MERYSVSIVDESSSASLAIPIGLDLFTVTVSIYDTNLISSENQSLFFVNCRPTSHSILFYFFI